MTDTLFYAGAGLLVGTMVGLTGVGGGSMMTPILMLAFGQSPSVAVGTDLLFSATTKLVATASFGLVKMGSNGFRTVACFWLSPGECVAEHRKAADRFGLGGLVLQNVPVFLKNTVFEPDNVGCDPGGGPSQPRKAAMRYDVIAFCDDELVLIMSRLRH